MTARDPYRTHAVLAGVVCALVGFTSSFAVVLQGLRAVGAGPDQAASGLLALSVAMGVGCIAFSWRRRQPITMAWSTPGAAMLAGATVPAGGFSAAVGAFVVCGLLLALTGLVRPLGRAMERVPAPLASAMLAGVLLHLCVVPFTALVADPAAVGPVVAAWFLVRVVAPRWAVPAGVAAALVELAVTGALTTVDPARAVPGAVVVAPTFSPGVVLALGVPLYLVTMTSQNLPGVGVLRQYGYDLRVREPFAYTGLASMASAVLGGHAINLAAISAALAAGPEAHPDRDRRWVAGVACGVTYLVLGLCSGLVTGVAAAAPPGLLGAVAGVALLATFASSAAAALDAPSWREPAAIAIVVGASGVVVAGVGSAFWALVAGGVVAAALRRSRP